MEQEKVPHKAEKKVHNYETENALLEQVWQRVVQVEAEPIGAQLGPKPLSLAQPVGQKQTVPKQNEWEDLDKLLPIQIRKELDDMRAYQRLSQLYARKAQVFSALAKEELRHAKRLCAAYFLRTGIRYWPMKPMQRGTMSEYCSVLRSRFLAEQSQAENYRALSKCMQEKDLEELYQTLAEEEQEHVRTIRRLLEEAI